MVIFIDMFHFSTCPNWVLQVSTTTMKIIITHYHSHSSFLSSLSCLHSPHPKKKVTKKLRVVRFERLENYYNDTIGASGRFRENRITFHNKWWINTSQVLPRFGGENRSTTFSPASILNKKKGENPYDWNPCRSRGHNLTLYYILQLTSNMVTSYINNKVSSLFAEPAMISKALATVPQVSSRNASMN